MVKDFHSKPFNAATQIKLEIFRRYIRKWLPTFMTRYSGGKENFKTIRIYDFFSGPGYDASDNPGSPIIIVDELKKFCTEHEELKAEVEVHMYFNDIEAKNIEKLETNIARIACDQNCCKIQYSTLPFEEILKKSLPVIQKNDSANLIIMDQFGIKDVTPEIISIFSKCKVTDIIFFISSSFIYRFKEELGVKLGMTPEDMKNLEYNSIHRYICTHFRKEIKKDNYYLSPFSIKKEQNIYGIIFGSGHLLGLEKFLQACWEIDTVTGESNYNIDSDLSWNGQLSLFPQDNIIRKIDIFEKNLIHYIKTCQPDNQQVDKFCLEYGFCRKKAKESLIKLKDSGHINIIKICDDTHARKNAFYLAEKRPIVRYMVRNEKE